MLLSVNSYFIVMSSKVKNLKRTATHTPDLVQTLLCLCETDINLLNKNILLNLTNEQLRRIYATDIINLPLCERLREEDRIRFLNKFIKKSL